MRVTPIIVLYSKEEYLFPHLEAASTSTAGRQMACQSLCIGKHLRRSFQAALIALDGGTKHRRYQCLKPRACCRVSSHLIIQVITVAGEVTSILHSRAQVLDGCTGGYHHIDRRILEQLLVALHNVLIHHKLILLVIGIFGVVGVGAVCPCLLPGYGGTGIAAIKSQYFYQTVEPGLIRLIFPRHA